MNKMLIAMMLMLNLHNSDQSLDISDIIKKSEKIASVKFDKDVMDNKYTAKKWVVCNRFVKNNDLSNILQDANKGECVDSTASYSLNIDSYKQSETTNPISMKADEDFNYVEVVTPCYDKKRNVFTTILWIKDKSYTSGFCILVDYKVVKNKCIFIKGYPMVISDIQQID
ncbi:hypothetical protein GCM10023149_40300 [Mucilaginibacter gynuensis]|uniref:Uncharacterized protein n=1 Tax=Mucilaginibacter gynuensis TaxID=1302236 RepID=A0ABP8H2R7_9SPHI